MTKLPHELLKHIRDECQFLITNSTGIELDDLLEDEVLKRAFIRSIEIIGEASKSIPNSYKSDHGDVPWKEMAGMRDILIHRYSGVDITIVYDVVKERIPLLLDSILILIDDY